MPVPFAVHPREKKTSLQQVVTPTLLSGPIVEYPRRGRAALIGDDGTGAAGCCDCSLTRTTSKGVTINDVNKAPEIAEIDF